MKKIRHWPQKELEYVRDCRERLKPVSYSDIAKALGRSIRECQSRYHYYFGDHKRNDEMLPANITICWLCKHTNRFDVGECPVYKITQFPRRAGEKKNINQLLSTCQISFPRSPARRRSGGLCEGGNYNGQDRHPI